MKVKLGDLTKIRTGKLDANAASENGKYPFFTCSKEPLRISTYSYDCECVLVAGNGDLNTKYYNGKFDAYQRTYIIESNSDRRLYLPYLYYFMTRYIQDLRRLSIGGVIKYIKLGNLTDAEISLPDIEEQKVACKKLEKVKNIIDKKESQLFYLDNLIKARFVEMFGDVYKTSKYPKQKWNNIVTIKNGKDYKKVAVNKGGYPVYGTGGEIARTSEFLCPENTIIVGRKGTINNPLLVREKFWNVDTAFGVIPSDKLHYLYFFWFCKMFDFSRLNKQAVLPSTTKADLLNIEMQVPPIEIQNKFAAFVAQVDKSKFALSNELAMGNFYIRLIYDCIMHGCIDL